MSNDQFPPFSVLMSVYREENPRFLDEALKSIENQTVKADQIVLVEDGPLTLDLNKIIEKHVRNFPCQYDVLKLDRNRGLGVALQKGVLYCRNEWIARMDTDDISVNNRFELQLKAIMKDPSLAVVGGQIDEFSGNLNKIVGHRLVPLSNCKIRKFIKWRNPFNHPTVMFNKTVVLKVGNYQPNGKIEDYFLWAKIITANHPVKNIPDILVHMRVDAGMYNRRGDLDNITQIIYLRKFLHESRFISLGEEYLGNIVMIINTIVPSNLRKYIYRKILHKNKRKM